MARIVLLKQAAEATGLSQWELRMGAKAGRYPHVRVGSTGNGKILFDLDILEAHLQKMFEDSIKPRDNEAYEFGKLRQVKAR